MLDDRAREIDTKAVLSAEDRVFIRMVAELILTEQMPVPRAMELERDYPGFFALVKDELRLVRSARSGTSHLRAV